MCVVPTYVCTVYTVVFRAHLCLFSGALCPPMPVWLCFVPTYACTVVHCAHLCLYSCALCPPMHVQLCIVPTYAFTVVHCAHLCLYSCALCYLAGPTLWPLPQDQNCGLVDRRVRYTLTPED